MPGADRDDDSGQYTETYPTEEFLDAIAAADDMAGTQDVADYVGCSYETAYKKLRQLEDEGAVESRKVANARVWSTGSD
jgi:predicted ArsR family transcriptional regulator